MHFLSFLEKQESDMSAKNQLLIRNKKFEGKYVALRSFTDNTVIAYGKDPSEVLAKAHSKGSEAPVVIFIPKEKTTYIY